MEGCGNSCRLPLTFLPAAILCNSRLPVGAHCQPKAAMADQSLQTPDDAKKANRYSSQYSSHFHGANIGGLNLNVNLGTIQQYIVDGKIGGCLE